MLKDKFEHYIKEYNEIIERKIIDNLDQSFKEVKKDCKLSLSELTVSKGMLETNSTSFKSSAKRSW